MLEFKAGKNSKVYKGIKIILDSEGYHRVYFKELFGVNNRAMSLKNYTGEQICSASSVVYRKDEAIFTKASLDHIESVIDFVLDKDIDRSDVIYYLLDFKAKKEE